MDAPILVVEDDPQIAELLQVYLSREGLRVVTVASAEAAQGVLTQDPPALMLLDLNLPGMDGFQFLRTLKGSSLPVIIVSSRESDEDKVGGLGLGADDFVTKPFSPKVLVARVLALLRRTRSAPGRVTFGPFVLDTETCSLTREGRAVALRRREYDLLAYLAARPGRPQAPEDLYREVWGQEYGDLTTVAVHVQRLRKKLDEPAGSPRYLKTLAGFGYCFDPEGQP